MTRRAILRMLPPHMKIRKYIGGMVMTNGYLLGEGEHSVLIDAPSGVTDWLEQEGELPGELLLTHQHYDHVEDVARLAAKGVKIRAFAEYSKDLTLENFREQWGMPIEVAPYRIDDVLGDSRELTSGGMTFRIEHVPGHSPDSIIFITGEHDDSGPALAFVGDTLFADSIGRPDLPGGDQELLLTGIREKLLTLPEETRIFPGHGFETSIGRERSGNPFL
ncbi:MBL fold metallo-hydrolase [Verrucomicrobiaceae bacterium R5-34]|nr:MBL fold metallo-hydrolase [Verrucomicrobiaceae bacterium R5-34]